MKITVLMSTYNGEKYLRCQLDSILNQTLPADCAMEILIRDDGSNDGTTKILDEYVKKYDNISWYTGENLRPGKSFWNLVKAAGSSDFYAFADQDDFWNPDKLSAGINVLLKEHSNIPLLYNSAVTVADENLKELPYSISPEKAFTDLAHSLIYSFSPGCTYIFNEAARKEFIKYDQAKEFPQLHDWLAVRITALLGKVIYDPNEHMLYRQHGDNAVGASFGRKSLSETAKRAKRFLTSTECVRSHTAASMLRVYGNEIGDEQIHILNMVANYKNNPELKTELINSPLFKTGTGNDTYFKILVKMGRL